MKRSVAALSALVLAAFCLSAAEPPYPKEVRDAETTTLSAFPPTNPAGSGWCRGPQVQGGESTGSRGDIGAMS